jgi:dTDP-glucose 4,6-dehydratase
MQFKSTDGNKLIEMSRISKDDLDHILNNTYSLWNEMKGQKIFITGGTGFFGHWLLESFIYINDQLGLGAKAVVLSRHPEIFAENAPYLAHNPAIQLIRGDVCTFDFPEGEYQFVIHAATDMNAKDYLSMFESMTQGTKRTLEFAQTHGTQKLLLTSSGAVYGKQPVEMDRIPETFTGGPDPIDTAFTYGEGKRVSEVLCTLYSQRSKIETSIARCFTFVGPFLSSEKQYAIGNFIRDAIKGGPIVVKGDGNTLRSYLYAADLAIWLWTILLNGKKGQAYNVGSSEIISIAELANEVSQKISPSVPVKFEISDQIKIERNKYIPSTVKAEKELNLKVLINRSDGISKTIEWYKRVEE